MSKIAIWNNYIEYSNNRMFQTDAYEIGEDLGYPIIRLKQEFEAAGYEVETLDRDDPKNYDAVIFLDYPNPKRLCCNLNEIEKCKRFLILTECEMIYPENSRTDLLEEFEKVFTYDDNLVNDCNYIKLNIPNKIKKPLENLTFNEKKLCAIIAGNKCSALKGELYSERLSFIKYMEKKHFSDFDLYGVGWDEKNFKGLFSFFNRFPFLKSVCANKRPSYCGRVDKKIETLSKYKFTIAYENTKSIPGYISEKIWDSFFAGCIPVYYGAPNILDYIPENCFVDRRRFVSNEELSNYLYSINEAEYEQYRDNIRKFLRSSDAMQFSAEFYVHKIIEEVLNEKSDCGNFDT